MADKTPEEIAAEVAEAQRIEAEAEAARLAAAAAQHEEQQQEEEDDLPPETDEPDPAEALLATRFKNDPLKATRAFANADQMIGKQGTILGEQKKILEGLGYTFDDKGMPVAPKPKDEPVKPVETPAPQAVPGTQYVVNPENGWHVDPQTGKQYNPADDYTHEGKVIHAWRDKFGTYDLSEADWETVRRENPTAYATAYPKWQSEKYFNERKWNDRIEREAETVLPRSRAAFEAEVAKLPAISTSPVIKGILDTAEKNLRTMGSAADRANPQAYAGAVVIELLKDPAVWLSDLEQRITEQVQAKYASNPRIVATETGGGAGSGINAGNGADPKLDPDMERERRKFNSMRRGQGQPEVSAKTWMENQG